MIIEIVRLLDLMLSFQYSISLQNKIIEDYRWHKGRRGHDRMVVGFISTFAFSAYHH